MRSGICWVVVAYSNNLNIFVLDKQQLPSKYPTSFGKVFQYNELSCGYLRPSGHKYPPAKPLQNIMNWGIRAGICSYFQEKWPSFGQPVLDFIRSPRARAQQMLLRCSRAGPYRTSTTDALHPHASNDSARQLQWHDRI